MTALRIYLVAGWLAIAAITAWAAAEPGLVAAVETFVSDLGHPWRRQFYADLELHLLLVAGWIVWRERSLGLGLLCAAATMMLGALFTLPYLLFASVAAEGDAAALLLGSRRARLS